MIHLYQVVPNPSTDGRFWGRLCVDDFPEWRCWHGQEPGARISAQEICKTIGTRPCPGIQHTRPIPIVVVEVTYTDIVDVARGRPKSRREVYRIWQLPDGSWATQEPASCPEPA